MKVALFDSGLGGLSILKELNKFSFGLELFYFADSQYHPYGQLNQSQLLERTTEISKIFEELNVDLIVLACNTATVNCISTLRNTLKVPFVGVEPYLNIVKHKKTNSVCLLATKGTCEAPFLKNKAKEAKVFIHPCPNLASGIEKYLLDKNLHGLQKIFEKDLNSVRGKFSDYILGCTHYGLVFDELESYLQGVCHSTEIPVVKRIFNLLKIELDHPKKKNSIFFKDSLDSKWELLNADQFLASPALNNLVN